MVAGGVLTLASIEGVVESDMRWFTTCQEFFERRTKNIAT